MEWQSADVREFIQTCIHCLVSRAGYRTQQPSTTALHGQRPKEVSSTDLLYITNANKRDLKYILVIKDGISSYYCLHPVTGPILALQPFHFLIGLRFRKITRLVSDEGPHFTILLMKNLTDYAHECHHLTTAYSPWADETVEKLREKMVREMRALPSKWRLSTWKRSAVVEAHNASSFNRPPGDREGGIVEWETRNALSDGSFCRYLTLATANLPFSITKIQGNESLENGKGYANIRCGILAQSFGWHPWGSVHQNWGKPQKLRKFITWEPICNIPHTYKIGKYLTLGLPAKRRNKLHTKWIDNKKTVASRSIQFFVVQDIMQARQRVV